MAGLLMRTAMFLTVAAVGIAGEARSQAAPTLVFIVRHAEKATEPGNDPPLSAAGQARAKELAELLATADIKAIISTPFARTRGTAAPLAERTGVAIDTVGVGRDHAKAVADLVRKHAGHAVLVVGHSNTITAIAAALGAPKLPDLCDGDYDQLFMLELVPDGAPRFVRARFGAPATDPKCSPMGSR